MTTPNQSSEPNDLVKALAADACVHQGVGKSCTACWAVVGEVLDSPLWQRMAAERDEAIRERDEARAQVTTLSSWLHAAGVAPELIRAALSGGAGEQDKAEEDER